MMSLGTYLLGAAFIVLIGAYVGRPLRRDKLDADNVIEQWVSDARLGLVKIPPVSPGVNELTPVSANVDPDQVNFCPQCGRRVEADHRFCPGCGTPLQNGAAQ